MSKTKGATEHVYRLESTRADAIRAMSLKPRTEAQRLEIFDLLKQIIKTPKNYVEGGPKKIFRRTWLHVASIHGNLEAVTALVNAGDDVNETDDILRTPLLYAITSGDFETVEFLIESGADIHYDKCFDKFTPLFTAAEFGFIEIFRLLISKGCDYNLLGPNHMTVGHVICQNAHPTELLDILFDKNHEIEFDIDVQDSYGRTMVQICKDAIDRNPKPYNQVALAAQDVKGKFKKLLNHIYDEIDERKRIRYYDELKQREKLEEREKQLGLINNTDAIEKLQEQINAKMEAFARGETIEEHDYEDWHGDLLSQKNEEEAAQALKEQHEREEAERKYLEEAEAERIKEEAELKALYEKQQTGQPKGISDEKKAELNRRFQEKEMMKQRKQYIRKTSNMGLPVV